MLYFKELNYDDSYKQYLFLKSIPPNENGFINKYHDITFENYKTNAIKERIDSSSGRNLMEGCVPDTYFFLYNDNIIVGLFKVRHHLNDFLRSGAGHIGFYIDYSYRKKGYATKGLHLALEKLKTLVPKDETEAYLSSNIDNVASLKAQLKNGGYIEHSDAEKNYVRIPLKVKND